MASLCNPAAPPDLVSSPPSSCKKVCRSHGGLTGHPLGRASLLQSPGSLRPPWPDVRPPGAGASSGNRESKQTLMGPPTAGLDSPHRCKAPARVSPLPRPQSSPLGPRHWVTAPPILSTWPRVVCGYGGVWFLLRPSDLSVLTSPPDLKWRKPRMPAGSPFTPPSRSPRATPHTCAHPRGGSMTVLYVCSYRALGCQMKARTTCARVAVCTHAGTCSRVCVCARRRVHCSPPEVNLTLGWASSLSPTPLVPNRGASR